MYDSQERASMCFARHAAQDTCWMEAEACASGSTPFDPWGYYSTVEDEVEELEVLLLSIYAEHEHNWGT
ncbi:hypothetical protein Pcinc_007776 [Petrolisthes cinctipes]|uniref:Uncharacterized protein n=1 Tax=Petrolisthes cinctipes TaxID=88211 RepID=A0AAE1GA57_PETCI|nr:hypothetical protein Pcinc_007776 [Petrolisthes cinctipes]